MLSPLRIAPLAPPPLDGSPAGILLRHLSAQLLRARTHASKDTWKLSSDDYATGVRRRERRGKLMKTLRAAITIVHTPDSGANLQSLLDSIQKVRDEVRDLTPPAATNRLAAATQSVPGNVLPLWEIDADLQGAEETSIDSLTVEETAVAMPSVEDYKNAVRQDGGQV